MWTQPFSSLGVRRIASQRTSRCRALGAWGVSQAREYQGISPLEGPSVSNSFRTSLPSLSASWRRKMYQRGLPLCLYSFHLGF